MSQALFDARMLRSRCFLAASTALLCLALPPARAADAPPAAGAAPPEAAAKDAAPAGLRILYSGARPLASELGAYFNYAAIYRRSPEGLDVKKGVPAEQRAILQKLAWETVSKYPEAGVTTDPLAGWKPTEDLPDDTVVTDYNVYIEALPKSERPGVSNVKYFTDGAGRDAVLVIVYGDGKPWHHVLVYDKEHRRASVTKQLAPPEAK